MKKREKMVILVTGGSSGIGYDTAIRLAQKGHKVYAAARRVAMMEPLKEYGITPMLLDVTDKDSREAVVDAIAEREGRIDALVNNAGYGYFGAIENVSSDEAHRQLEVNVFGLAEMCRLVLPHMRSQHRGRIVNIASIAGRAVFPLGGWYHVSKYSVEALSDALRSEVKRFGIEVSIIEPGCIATDWGIIAAEHLEQSSKGTPYETPGMTEAALMKWAYSNNRMTSPSRISKAIVRACCSRCPRTRYRLGRFSRISIFMHHVLPTRWWDAMLRKMLSLKLK